MFDRSFPFVKKIYRRFTMLFVLETAVFLRFCFLSFKKKIRRFQIDCFYFNRPTIGLT